VEAHLVADLKLLVVAVELLKQVKLNLVVFLNQEVLEEMEHKLQLTDQQLFLQAVEPEGQTLALEEYLLHQEAMVEEHHHLDQIIIMVILELQTLEVEHLEQRLKDQMVQAVALV
jgi:hypothetical protein